MEDTRDWSQAKAADRALRVTLAQVLVGVSLGLLAELSVHGVKLAMPFTVLGNARGIATMWSFELFLWLCVGSLLRRLRGTSLVLALVIFLLQPVLLLYFAPELWSVSGGSWWLIGFVLPRVLGLYLPRALMARRGPG